MSTNVYIHGSISRFLDVSSQSSGFADTDVVNVNGDAVQKAGTFHDRNIFRRAFRWGDERMANNNTRQQFLNSLKETFGLTESGKDLVNKLGRILGKDVFKPEDYTFDKNGVIDCGRPLTARRIKAVSEKIVAMHSQAMTENDNKVNQTIQAVCNKLKRLYTLLDTGKLPKVSNSEMNDIYTTIYKIQNEPEEMNDAKYKYRYVGFSAALRVAVNTLDRTSEEREALFNAIMEGMTADAKFAEAYNRHEKLIDEHYSLKGIKRPENDGLGVTTTSMTVEVALDILKLPLSSSMEDVRKAYKKLASQHHPDKLANLPEDQKKVRTELYTRIVSAHEFLKAEFDNGHFGKTHRMPANRESEPDIPQQPSNSAPLFIGNGNREAEMAFLAQQSQELIIKP